MFQSKARPAFLEPCRQPGNLAAPRPHRQRIQRRARVGENDAFARVDERIQNGVHGAEAASRDEHFAVRIHGEAVVGEKLGRDRLAQLGQAGDRRPTAAIGWQLAGAGGKQIEARRSLRQVDRIGSRGLESIGKRFQIAQRRGEKTVAAIAQGRGRAIEKAAYARQVMSNAKPDKEFRHQERISHGDLRDSERKSADARRKEGGLYRR